MKNKFYLITILLGLIALYLKDSASLFIPVFAQTSPAPIMGSNKITLNLRLKFQGITKRPITLQSIPIQFQLIRGFGNNRVVTPPVFADFTALDNGVFIGKVAFVNVPSGENYALTVKGFKHLKKKFCDVNSSEKNPGEYKCREGKLSLQLGDNILDFSGVTLFGGDLGTQDGFLNAYDISRLLNSVGKNDESSKADLNMDGKVDKTDYNLISETIAKTSGVDEE
jgi:hypothetical protein